MKDEREAPEEMEEPMPCPDCGEWVELQSTRACPLCYEIFCPRCLEEGLCVNCREEE
jgi:hypothetical protein